MRRFRDFLRESPHETESVVPVAVYLHQPVDLTRPVAALYAEVCAGRACDEQTVGVARLVPTQVAVNQRKVVAFSLHPGSVLPVVAPLEDGRYYLVDGHHHVCGAVLAGQTSVRVRVMRS
jgi:hypothetical protein